jgi:hypothetical protein
MVMEDEDPLVRRLEVAAKLLSLLYASWMVWTIIPPSRKQQWRMQILRGIRNGADWAASLTGRQAITQEALSGTEPSHFLPYGFSRMRDWAARRYDRARW